MFREKKSRKILERLKRSNREWLLREGTAAMREMDLRYIDENVDSQVPGTRSNVADGLHRLATWYGIAGQVAIMDGSPEGWLEIHRSWLYTCLSLRLQMSVFQRGRVLGEFRPVKSLSLEASTTALCLAYALVVDRDFETTFFSHALKVMLVDKSVVRDDYWNYHHLEPFILQLLMLFRKEDSVVSKDFGRELGPYQAIIASWREPSSLAESLHTICEYHCERIEDKSDDYFAEFRNAPFDLVPAEVLAIYSVRRSLGLETPKIDHPLVESPFNAPVGSPSEVEDSLLEQIEARI